MKKFFRLSLIFFSAILCFCGISFFDANSTFAFTTDPSYATYVDEIWNENKFDNTNLTRLLQLISGNESASTSNFFESNLSAKEMREKNALDKKPSSDIVVKFGGLDWTVTYLSKDSNGNKILTLWLSDSEQLKDNKNAVWSKSSVEGDITTEYPSNMYGTSYVNAVVLNNGGEYLENDALVFAEQSEDSVFSKFTVNKAGIDLSDFIVTPSRVGWQNSGQSAKNLLNTNYNSSNENLAKKLSNVGFYFDNDNKTYFNYAKKDKSDAWASSKLWLPSLSEIGNEDDKGLWGVSSNQRYQTDEFWLRSATPNNTSGAVTIYSSFSGEGTVGTAYSLNSTVTGEKAIRPALHLNLTAACRSARGLNPFANDSTWWIILVSVGGGLIVVGAVVWILIYYKKRKNNENKQK